MAIVTRNVFFAQSTGAASGSFTVPNNINGSTVEVTLIGEGGAGGAGVPSTGHGGGGGGAGAVVFGSFPVSAGQTLTVTHTPSNDRTTSGNGAAGGSMSITNGSTTWTAGGGGGGQNGNGGAGGSGGSGSGSGASINTGGDGGAAGVTGGANGGQGTNPSGGTRSNGGTNGTVGNGGGGGGRTGGVPQYVADGLTDAGVFPLVALDGGDGASNTGDVTNSRNATSNVYLGFDGEDGKIDTNPTIGFDEFEYIGMGGGGAGAPHTSSTGNGLGGAGGQALCVIQYEIDGSDPVINMTGNFTPALPHIVEVGGSFVEPGVTATDFEGINIPVVTSLATELQSPISGTIGSGSPPSPLYDVDYSATDQYGGTAAATRKCVVQDTTGPVISLIGDNPLYVKNGSTYSEPGATAIDNDGTTYVTNDITIDNSTVDTSQNGQYTVSYELDDATGNTTTTTRTVEVVDEISPAANDTGPIEAPSSGAISFGQILAASQLWRAPRPDLTKSKLNTTDAYVRLKGSTSINALRTWFVGHGLCPGATVNNNTSPGAKSNVGLTSQTSSGTTLNLRNFRGYSALTTQVRVIPESVDVYRNKDNAQVEVVCWGATSDGATSNTTGSNQKIYTVTISGNDATGASYTQSGTGYGNSSTINKATFTNLGVNVYSAGTGNSTIGNSSFRDPNTTHTYNLTISYTPAGASSAVTYEGLQVQIGHAGTADNHLKIKTSSGTTSQDFQWSGSSTASAGTWSDYMRQHVGFTAVER